MKWTRDWLSLRYRFLESQLRKVDLQEPDPEDLMPLDESDVLADLEGGFLSPRFLGYFTRRGLINLFEHMGLISRLHRAGFEPHLSLRITDADRQLLRVYDGQEVPTSLLVEVAAHIEEPQLRLLPQHMDDRYRLLAIDWLLLQNPRASFTAHRPRLPGQNYPGLRIGTEVGEAFILIGLHLRCDGVVATPTHFHNGVLYSRKLRAIDPVRQAEILALSEDLSSLNLAEQSWAIELGCVEDATGRVYRWPTPAMLFPFQDDLADYLSGADYRQRMQQARRDMHFRLDMEKFDRLHEPL